MGKKQQTQIRRSQTKVSGYLFLHFSKKYRPLEATKEMSDKDKDSSATTGKEAVDSKKKMAAVDLGLLEEDDEFEEFPAEEWDRKDEDSTDVNVWEDNWDDDTVEDDFSVQLRGELQNQGVKMES